MKIRIKDNSLRYRLTQSEVARLCAEGAVEARTGFPGKTFIYAIEATDSDSLSADYTGDKIILFMPKKMVDELHKTDKVSFEDKSGPVSLLVEKDFVCIDNMNENQSDNYPNPRLNR